MKRKRLTGWKRMAAFAMALTLTVGDWTPAGAADGYGRFYTETAASSD